MIVLTVSTIQYLYTLSILHISLFHWYTLFLTQVSYLARPYPEQSRKMLCLFLQNHMLCTCTAAEKIRFVNILKESGLDDLYMEVEEEEEMDGLHNGGKL